MKRKVFVSFSDSDRRLIAALLVMLALTFASLASLIHQVVPYAGAFGLVGFYGFGDKVVFWFFRGWVMVRDGLAALVGAGSRDPVAWLKDSWAWSMRDRLPVPMRRDGWCARSFQERSGAKHVVLFAPGRVCLAPDSLVLLGVVSSESKRTSRILDSDEDGFEVVLEELSGRIINRKVFVQLLGELESVVQAPEITGYRFAALTLQ